MPHFVLHHRRLPVLFVVLISAFALRTNAEPPKGKLPVPEKAAQQKALEAIREQYKDDYSKDKTALADKLIQKAREAQDATERYVLLQEAKKVAGDAYQGELAFAAIDEMASKYDISAAKVKAEVIEQAAMKVHLNKQKRTLAEAALLVVDAAVGEENFDVAKQMIQQAGQLAHLSETTTKSKEVEALAKAFADAQKARETLKEKPDDPDANLAVGKYLCLTKGDWGKGLPMLAKGSNARLQSLAERDMTGAATPAEKLKLGDMWWSVAKGRAVYWYKQALPGLDGRDKERVKKKLMTVEVCLSELQATEIKVLGDIHSKAILQGNSVSPHTFFAHPPSPCSSSHIAFILSKRFQVLQGAAGIGADVEGRPPASPLTFRIVGDGRLRWQSRPVQVANLPQRFRVDVSGVKKLELFVDCPAGHSFCAGLWIDPVLTK